MRSLHVALEYKIWWQFKYRKWRENLCGVKLLDSKACCKRPNNHRNLKESPVLFTLTIHSNATCLISCFVFFFCIRYIAVTHGKHVQVWHAPGYTREFAPLSLLRTYTGHYDDTVCIDWTADSRSVTHLGLFLSFASARFCNSCEVRCHVHRGVQNL